MGGLQTISQSHPIARGHFPFLFFLRWGDHQPGRSIQRGNELGQLPALGNGIEWVAAQIIRPQVKVWNAYCGYHLVVRGYSTRGVAELG